MRFQILSILFFVILSVPLSAQTYFDATEWYFTENEGIRQIMIRRSLIMSRRKALIRV